MIIISNEVYIIKLSFDKIIRVAAKNAKKPSQYNMRVVQLPLAMPFHGIKV